MILKLVGVVFVMVSCGAVGFRMAGTVKKEEQYLRRILEILDMISCELQYRLSPLPSICLRISHVFPSKIGRVFSTLEKEIRMQELSDVDKCMSKTLRAFQDLPPITIECLRLLGASLGHYGIDGQLQGLETVRRECTRHLEAIVKNRDERIHGYQTLGLCAGAAVAILLI